MTKRFEHPGDLEALFVVVCYLVSIVFGFGLIIWQCFKWLMTAVWTPIPVSTAFNFLHVDISFVYNAQQWIGLAKMARWFLDLPLSITLPVLIISFAHILSSAAARQRKNQASSTY